MTYLPGLVIHREGVYIPSQGADLRQGEYTDTSGHTKTVMVKVFRVKPTQEFINCLLALTEASSKLKDCNVSAFLGATYIGQSIAIVTPYYPNGNVVAFLRRLGVVTSEYRFILVRELVSAVAYLHTHEVVHGNIHGANVMIDNTGHAILVDFGIQNACYAGEYYPVPRSYRWKAREALISACDDSPPVKWVPEEIMIATEHKSSSNDTITGDIYSLGRTIEEIYTLNEPFPHIKGVFLFLLKLQERKLFEDESQLGDAPSCIRRLISVCCVEDPQSRPAAAALLEILENVKVR